VTAFLLHLDPSHWVLALGLLAAAKVLSDWVIDYVDPWRMHVISGFVVPLTFLSASLLYTVAFFGWLVFVSYQ